MNKAEIKSILKKHSKYLLGEKGGVRADLSGLDLSEVVYLSMANLREAYLRRTNLSGADLCGTDLRGADLTEADLSEADLLGADLSRADLDGANLTGADLRGTYLNEADLPSGVRIISVSGVGSARRMTTFRADTDEVWCGCFYGSLKEFTEDIERTHKENKTHLADYRAVVEMLEVFRTNSKEVSNAS